MTFGVYLPKAERCFASSRKNGSLETGDSQTAEVLQLSASVGGSIVVPQVRPRKAKRSKRKCIIYQNTLKYFSYSLSSDFATFQFRDIGCVERLCHCLCFSRNL